MKGYLINCKSSSLISYVVYVLCKYGTHVYINVSSLLDRKILVGENLANCELLAKISSPIFTGTLKMYLAYALTVAH